MCKRGQERILIYDVFLDHVWILCSNKACAIWQNYLVSETSNRHHKSSFENIFDKQYANHCCEAEDIPHKMSLQALLGSLVYGVFMGNGKK